MMIASSNDTRSNDTQSNEMPSGTMEVEAVFPEFLISQVHIQNRGGVRFQPWDWQLDLAREWQSSRRTVVLKARQLGVSWMAAAFALWTALSRKGAHVLLVSQTGTDARELLEKVRFIMEYLPEAQRPALGRNSALVLEFPALLSRVQALPSTPKAGRGKTAALVIADEHAFHPWAEANFAALAPTMDAGGRFLSISTANGAGGFFADLWAKSGQPDSGWRRRFLAYHAHPGRDEAWYEAKRMEYTRPWMIHQEYPRDPEEAFVQTGRPVFDRDYLEKHRRLCRQPLPPAQWPAPLRGCRAEELRVFVLPLPGARYIAGADVAEGLEHGDYSDLTLFVLPDLHAQVPSPSAECLPPNAYEEVLSLHGHWPPDEFAALIDRVARIYPGVYGVERNNHGMAVLVTLRRLRTPGIYSQRPVLDRLGATVEPGRPGWLTTSATKPLMIDELEEGLRHFALRLSDETALAELALYQTGPNGSTAAASGKWDDRVISRAIAWQMRKHVRPRRAPPPDPSDRPPATFMPLRW